MAILIAPCFCFCVLNYIKKSWYRNRARNKISCTAEKVEWKTKLELEGEMYFLTSFHWITYHVATAGKTRKLLDSPVRLGAFSEFCPLHQFDTSALGEYSKTDMEAGARRNPWCCFLGNIEEDLSLCRSEGGRIIFLLITCSSLFSFSWYFRILN